MATTVDVPKDSEGNDVPVLGLWEHPEHHAQVWAHTPADMVQYQAEGWKPVDTPKAQKAAASTDKREATGGGK
jgi:hypothetical protein